MKAWKRLRLLLSGPRRLTWPYRVPSARLLAPADTALSAGPRPPRRARPPQPAPHLASPTPPPRSRGCSFAAR